jgi:hypothetical protein
MAQELLLDFGQLLSHLLRWAGDIGPIESDGRRPLLQPIGHEECGERGYDAREHLSPALPALDDLPWLGSA